MDEKRQREKPEAGDGGWKRELMRLLITHGRFSTHARKGKLKPISDRTLAAREEILFMCFNQLREMGYKLQSVHSFRGKHLDVLLGRWKQEGVSAGTIQNRLSVLRGLAKWIGKEGMILGTAAYEAEGEEGRLQRTTVAATDKSWSAAGLAVERVVELARGIDLYVAMQLKVIHAFGLRREEAIQFKPYKIDEGGVLRVRDGTKGGRERLVPVDSDHQKAVLAEAKAFALKNGGSLGNPKKDLRQNIDRFSYVMRKLGITKSGLGVTAHGLRHQRLNDLFEEIAGIPSPVRQMTAAGGPVPSMPDTVDKGQDPERWELARQVVSNVAGHGRKSITSAYTGSAASVTKPRLDWTAGRTPAQVVEIEIKPLQIKLSGKGGEANVG